LTTADDDRALEARLRADPEVADALVARASTGSRRAFVVPRARGGDAKDAMLVWARIFDTHYAKGRAATVDSAFDTSAWNSSYTKAAMTAAEMEEWTASTVRRILLHAPPRPEGLRILELGCGTGLLLHRLLPRSARYVGVDASAEGLRTIETALSSAGADEARRVELSVGDALDAARAARGEFDAVVVNSVAQYFPSVEYLLALVEEALRLLAADGTLFLGDLRNSRLQRAFDASVVIPPAPREEPISAVRRRLAARERSEHETLYDPELFHALRALHPEIGAVTTAVRRGVFDNEMNRFRYDAVLRKGAVTEIDDVADDVRADEIAAALRASRRAALTSVDLTNPRVARWALLADRVAAAAPDATSGDVLDAVDAETRARPATTDPETLVSDAERSGWTAIADPGAAPSPEAFRVAFVRPSASPDALWLGSSLLRRDGAPRIEFDAVSNRSPCSAPPAEWRDRLVVPGAGRADALAISAVEPLSFRLLAAFTRRRTAQSARP